MGPDVSRCISERRRRVLAVEIHGQVGCPPHVLESSRHLPDVLETPPRCWNGKGEYIVGD